jgi:hypothetical protein
VSENAEEEECGLMNVPTEERLQKIKTSIIQHVKYVTHAASQYNGKFRNILITAI